MARTVLDVWNIALAEVGGRGGVASTSENTREASVMRRYYETVRDSVQEASWWSPCKKTERLALISERRQTDTVWTEGDPDDYKQYAFRIPNNYLRAWYLVTGDNFLISQIDDEPAIHTDAQDAVLVYAKKVTDPALWTVPLYDATWKMLAAAVARPLRGDQQLSARMFQEAQMVVSESRAAAANAESNQFESMPDWIVARHAYSQVTTRYLYPFGTLWNYAPLQHSAREYYNTVRR